MLCFEVSVNGELVCRAGVGAHGVLSAILSWVQISPEVREAQGREWTPSKPHLSVSGLVDQEHLRWLGRLLQVEIGDEVTIRVVEADIVDEPVARKDSANPATARRNRYELYKMYKKEFEAEGVLLPEDEIDSEVAMHMKRELYEQLKRELEGE